MTKKSIPGLIIFIFVASIFARSFTIINTPLIEEEKKGIAISNTISFTQGNRNLPFRDPLVRHPLLAVYLIKAGIGIFGPNVFGLRFFFFIFGFLMTFFIYIFVSRQISKRAGIIALVLVSFNLYHLGRSLMAVDEIIMLFFCTISMILFYKALKYGSFHLLSYCGVLAALGYLTDVKIALLIPVFFIYLICFRRDILSRKEPYLMLLAPLLIVFFDLYWIFGRQKLLPDVSFNAGISLRGLDFYLLRLFSFFSGVDYRGQVSWEIPSMSALDGLLIILGVLYCLSLSRKKEEIRFMLTAFLVPVFLINFFPKGEFWWSDVSFLPGIYLASFALSELWQKGKIYKVTISAVLMIIILQPLFFISETKRINIPPNRLEEYVDYDMDLMQWYFNKGLLEKAIDEAKVALAICPNEKRILNFLQSCLKQK